MRALLRTFSWQELRHHPWRSAAAVAAVMLGVALAFAVHVINTSALDEFSQAVRAVNGQPDLELRAMQGPLPEALYGPLARTPGVEHASPWLELSTLAQPPGAPSAPQASAPAPARVALRVLGADALHLAAVAPALMPRPFAGSERLALLAPDAVFLNTAALQALGLPVDANAPLPLRLQTGPQASAWRTVRVAGSIAAGGAPLAVMDIGAAQDLWAQGGRLSRIDLHLRPGTDRATLMQALRSLPGWPANAMLAEPGDAVQRIGNLSRAYRVNLTVLALVALFTGAFLVFSVLALSVAQRAPQFALLAVLGATPRQRMALVLSESALLGLVGSAAGIALGTVLAAAALWLLGGDLGGGYFAGAQPTLQWSAPAALLYGALGIAAALVGGWWPARAARSLPAAQTLKGQGATAGPGARPTIGMILIAAGTLLASAPPIFGIPLAAYAAIGLLLVGGIALLPWAMALLLQHLRGLVGHRLLLMLPLERARRMRGAAAIAVGGVVASLSLAVALTVMVASFRGSVTEWLDAVLPSPLYVRSALPAAAGDAALLPPGFDEAVARLPGVARVQPQRASALQLNPTRPALVLLSRPLGNNPSRALPLVGEALPVPAGKKGVYISEAVVDLYGLRPGMDWPALSRSFSPAAHMAQAQAASFFIAGVWRDYARQSGAVVMDRADYMALTGDTRATDLALWPSEGADLAQLQQAIRALAGAGAGAGQADVRGTGTGTDAGAQSPAGAGAADLEFVSVGAIRERSLRIFDRSFAVTYWLQAVAIGIGLLGVPASARRCWRGARNSACWRTWASPAGRFWPWWPARERHGPAWAPQQGYCWAWPWRWSWYTWSTPRASTGRWSCACPQHGCLRCARPWWPRAP
jgi:putative ABC transport system permease protein